MNIFGMVWVGRGWVVPGSSEGDWTTPFERAGVCWAVLRLVVVYGLLGYDTGVSVVGYNTQQSLGIIINRTLILN